MDTFQNMDFMDRDEDEKSNNKTRASAINTLKPVVAIICVVVGISAVVVLAVIYSGPSDEDGDFACELNPKSQRLIFNSTIEIICVYPSEIPLNNSVVSLEFIPKIDLNQTKDEIVINITLEQNTFQVGRWKIEVYKSSAAVKFHGDPIKCEGNGYYFFTLYSPAATENLNSQVDIKYESEVSSKRMVIIKSKKNDFYEITCSTSGYPPATIILQRTIQNTYPPSSVNSSCVMGCNENDGWSSRCTGSIPMDSVTSLDEITCRSIH